MSKRIICDICGRIIENSERAEIFNRKAVKEGVSFLPGAGLDVCTDCYNKFIKESGRNPVAHWIMVSGITPCCSNCGGCIEEKYHYKYCPFCGSYMIGELEQK